MVTQNSMSATSSGARGIHPGSEKPKPFIDLRSIKGRLWNHGRSNESLENESDLDCFLYDGFRRHGPQFVQTVEGRFGAAHYDEENGLIFLCRDWIGEVPLHYYLTDSSLIVANRIFDLQKYLGPEYRYEFVRVVPQSHLITIDAAEQYKFGMHARNTWNVDRHVLYYDFLRDANGAWMGDSDSMLEHVAARIRSSLQSAVRERLEASRDGQPPAVLLSGGIDSLSVAYCLSKLEPRTIAYTLAVGKGGTDVARARQIADHFELEFRTVKLEPGSILNQYVDAVRQCELYHLPNVYCAVGMVALARALREHGIITAFCGEGVNEALGDYQDWIVKDPTSSAPLLLQRVDHERMSEPAGRVRYVWGREHKEGRYNLQLGSGLAKHGIGRMVKPMIADGINLECPYLDRKLMRYLVSIPKGRLDAIGGKPGLMSLVFRNEIDRGAIPKEFITNSQKIRLQDGSDLGEGGISPMLLAAGFDQKNTINIFNRLFGATMNPDTDSERLSLCSA